MFAELHLHGVDSKEKVGGLGRQGKRLSLNGEKLRWKVKSGEAQVVGSNNEMKGERTENGKWKPNTSTEIEEKEGFSQDVGQGRLYTLLP